MERVLKFKSKFKNILPSVYHVDGSGRLHTVTKKSNNLYYNLIKRFGKKSGHPILLNTSFNENEPMVEKPDEAISVLERTDLDALIINNIFIEKK